MLTKLLINIISAGLGIFLAVMFVPMVSVQIYPDSRFFIIELIELWQIYLILAASLGLLNYLIKPIFDTISLPFRIITLGFFGFLINMGLVFSIDYIFQEFSAPFIWPLFWTTIITYTLNRIMYYVILRSGDY